MVVRLKDPERLASMIPASQSWATLMAVDLPSVQGLLLEHEPFEMIAVLPPRQEAELKEGKGPEPTIAYSVPVRSLQAGRDYFAGQSKSLEKNGAASFFHSPTDQWCLLGASVGSAPARIVCSKDPDAAATLVEYATRALPLEEIQGADAEVEIRFSALKPTFENGLREADKQVASLESRADRIPWAKLLGDTLSKSLQEARGFADDLDKIQIGVRTSTTQNVRLTATARFKSSTSRTASLLFDAGSRVGSAPDFFWRLPEDAKAASYLYEVAPTDFEGLRETTGNFMQALLTESGATPATLTVARRLVNDTFTSPGAYVVAQGHGVNATTRAPSADWLIFGARRPSTSYRAYLEDFTRLLKTKDCRALMDLKDIKSDVAPAVPVAPVEPGVGIGDWVRQHMNNGNLPQPLNVNFHLPYVDVPPMSGSACCRGLPSGSASFKFRVPKDWLEDDAPVLNSWTPLRNQKETTIFVVMMPDDTPESSLTWIGLGTDESLIVKKLASIKSDAQPMSSRRDLAALRETHAALAGFVMADELDSSLPKEAVSYTVAAPQAATERKLEIGVDTTSAELVALMIAASR